MTPEPPKVVTRHRAGRSHAYVVSAGVYGTLEPAAVFRPRDGDEAGDEVGPPSGVRGGRGRRVGR
ncbi:hypothetical protein ACIQ7S_16090 [Streptomyces griseoluteus]|uniref:hypothetical protein n=1 Tax=Streptomyces griseoluteus TaxID=29306 RepID=UPI003318F993